MKKILIPVVLFGILFISSSQTYEQQSLGNLLPKLLPNQPLESWMSKIHINYFGTMISVHEDGYYFFIEFILRKSAHFLLFGLLAASLFIVLQKSRLNYILAFLLTCTIAIADEYHQSITGGRTASFHDVILDSCGAVFFLVLIYFITLIRRRRILFEHRTFD